MCACWLPLATGCNSTPIKVRADATVGEPLPSARPDTLAVEDLPITIRDAVPAADTAAPPPPDLREDDLSVTEDGRVGVDWADAPTVVVMDAPPAEVSAAPAADGPIGADAGPPDVPPSRDGTGDPTLPPPEVHYGVDAEAAAELCTQTGGSITMGSYPHPMSDFPDTCGLLPCSHYCDYVAVCVCPNGCFRPGDGCASRAWAGCTLGQDQTCNDDPALSAIHGQCLDGYYCQCYPYAFNPTTGKCL